VGSDLSVNPSHRVAGSNVPASGALNKSMSDAKHASAGHGHADSSSSSYDDASPLHFHGLAVTQTQTQVASCADESSKGSTELERRVRILAALLVFVTFCFFTSVDHC
jgi:hypothetical protein